MNTAVSSHNTSFIPLFEAVKVTGVSEATLRRFADAGYFKTVQNNGDIEFQKDELFALFKIASKPSVERPSIVTTTQTKKIEIEEIETDEIPEIFDTDTTHSSTVTASIIAPSSQELLQLQAEVAKLTALSELHEKYISFKESEVKSLTDERDWLRTRIEKLEDKAERDQVIMVSLSETQRGLLNQLDKKRSTLQLALEWVGIILPANEKKN